jgi:putative ABC transport system substrate-binding protein
MRRRAFLALLGAALLPLSAGAQPTSKVKRIGYLGTNIGPASLPPIEAFQDGLRRLGWIEGQNVVVEYRWGRGQDDEIAAADAAELVRLNLDLIVAGSSVYARPLRRVTSTIPIVFCVGFDPIAEGFVASLARPGGNMTGLSAQQTEILAKSLELLTQAVPAARRIVVLWDPGYPTHAHAVPAIETTARNLAVELRWMPAGTLDELEAAFAAIGDTGAQAVWILGSSVSYSNRERLAQLALEHRLPSAIGSVEGVEAGCLLSYSTELNAIFRRCAAFVDKILKGTKPADLPVEQVPYHLAINLKTARALGLTIPPEILARADEVLE